MTALQRFDTPAGPRLPRGFDVPFADAIAWAEQRKAVLPTEFYGARLQAVRARSFTVTGLATLDQVQAVADASTAATASGQTFRDWQRTVLASDQNGELFSLGRARRELIFRNAVQTNYGIGRTIQQRENAAARPYLMWDAINDSRTRDSHRAMDSHIAPIDDPIWRKWNAPAGHNCRCTRIALTEAQARARGYPKAAPLVEPDKGWEGDPTEGNDDLVRIVQARRDSCATTFAPKFKGRGLWCEHPNARALLDEAQQALINNRLVANNPKAIPDADRAYIPDEKVFGYALNPEHGSGKHKAKVFASALGFTQANARELKILLLQGLLASEARPKGADVYGQRFEVDIPVNGPTGRALVRTGWIIDRIGDAPRLTSLYVRGGEE